jgi:NAD(P)-dependent dehydrogenase (short-subunit alcohol dehydrogenase family)
MAPVFLVTGGASGLGRAASTALASVGVRIAVADRDLDGAKAAAAELQRDHPNKAGDHAAFGCDVSDAAAVRACVDSVMETMGELWGVVNCAGIGLPATTLTREAAPMDHEVFDTVLGINLRGTFLCASAGASAIAKSKDKIEAGRKATANNPHSVSPIIINVASVAAFEGQKGQVPYSASKGAIVAMSLPMARDLARYGIRYACCLFFCVCRFFRGFHNGFGGHFLLYFGLGMQSGRADFSSFPKGSCASPRASWTRR